MRSKEAMKLSDSERKSKIKDLRIELIKSKLPNKKSNVSPKEIRTTIARLMTAETLNKNKEVSKN